MATRNMFALAKTVGIPEITVLSLLRSPSPPADCVCIFFVKFVIFCIDSQVYSLGGGVSFDLITSDTKDIIY